MNSGNRNYSDEEVFVTLMLKYRFNELALARNKIIS